LFQLTSPVCCSSSLQSGDVALKDVHNSHFDRFPSFAIFMYTTLATILEHICATLLLLRNYAPKIITWLVNEP
jgi:hypothetical protein